MAVIPAVRRSRGCRQLGFTLVEMLAAIAVFAVLMLMLFNLIAGAQRAWAVSSSTTEIYEKARIALDLITRDLQSAVARAHDYEYSGTTYDIRFQQVDYDELRFVSAGAVGYEGSTSLLCEVGYRHVQGPISYEFQRARENSNCSVTAPDGRWDIYQDRSGSEGCVNNQNGFMDVVDGVLGLTFICYDSSMAQRVPWIGAGLETGLPSAVEVQIRLIDSKSLAQWKLLSTAQDKARLESQVALTFSKMVFLGGRQ
jgi:prepilin-type N-terminal cleavage/methylation domain-containing protein